VKLEPACINPLEWCEQLDEPAGIVYGEVPGYVHPLEDRTLNVLLVDADAEFRVDVSQHCAEGFR